MKMAFSSTKCMARSKSTGLVRPSVATLFLAALPVGLRARGRLLREGQRCPARQATTANIAARSANQLTRRCHILPLSLRTISQ